MNKKSSVENVNRLDAGKVLAASMDPNLIHEYVEKHPSLTVRNFAMNKLFHLVGKPVINLLTVTSPKLFMEEISPEAVEMESVVEEPIVENMNDEVTEANLSSTESLDALWGEPVDAEVVSEEVVVATENVTEAEVIETAPVSAIQETVADEDLPFRLLAEKYGETLEDVKAIFEKKGNMDSLTKSLMARKSNRNRKNKA